MLVWSDLVYIYIHACVLLTSCSPQVPNLVLIMYSFSMQGSICRLYLLQKFSVRTYFSSYTSVSPAAAATHISEMYPPYEHSQPFHNDDGYLEPTL